MTVLILGANGSGKSLFAEKLIRSLTDGPLIYIATMLPYGDEGLRRVEKHKAQRSGLGFMTIEAPYSLAQLAFDEHCSILLEDVSNLLANAVFEKGTAPESVFMEIQELAEKCGNLVMVSIDGLSEGDGDNDETKAYIKALDEINKKLSEWADKNYRMVDGTACEV